MSHTGHTVQTSKITCDHTKVFTKDLTHIILNAASARMLRVS